MDMKLHKRIILQIPLALAYSNFGLLYEKKNEIKGNYLLQTIV
jgi:hypothetical protein